jgi:putative membrane protein
MSDIPLSANELAQERTEMGFGRTVMALERTLMAWIRTSLSLISFGFTIFKFLQAVHDTSGGRLREHAPRNLGFFMILLGMGLLLLAMIQFVVAMKNIQRFSDKKTPMSLSLIGAIGVLLVGIFAVLNMFFGFGGV